MIKEIARTIQDTNKTLCKALEMKVINNVSLFHSKNEVLRVMSTFLESPIFPMLKKYYIHHSASFTCREMRLVPGHRETISACHETICVLENRNL